MSRGKPILDISFSTKSFQFIWKRVFQRWTGSRWTSLAIYKLNPRGYNRIIFPFYLSPFSCLVVLKSELWKYGACGAAADRSKTVYYLTAPSSTIRVWHCRKYIFTKDDWINEGVYRAAPGFAGSANNCYRNMTPIVRENWTWGPTGDFPTLNRNTSPQGFSGEYYQYSV